jgi:hypothetical protein
MPAGSGGDSSRSLATQGPEPAHLSAKVKYQGGDLTLVNRRVMSWTREPGENIPQPGKHSDDMKGNEMIMNDCVAVAPDMLFVFCVTTNV